ncbi:unnamed protein product [Bemisia tabaci]|uniref:BTB domain-containing protein n=1 Tax=Bemisia tabaci TaxID=7038 RepID=A0A9P0F3M9_BEMTA|nr:unnamed protein product [Bemisia tabaci]
MSTENKELVLLISKITGPTNPKFSKYLPHILRRLKNNDSEIDILLKHQDFFEILKAALTKPGCDTTILFLSILDICCCKSSFCSELSGHNIVHHLTFILQNLNDRKLLSYTCKVIGKLAKSNTPDLVGELNKSKALLFVTKVLNDTRNGWKDTQTTALYALGWLWNVCFMADIVRSNSIKYVMTLLLSENTSVYKPCLIALSRLKLNQKPASIKCALQVSENKGFAKIISLLPKYPDLVGTVLSTLMGTRACEVYKPLSENKMLYTVFDQLKTQPNNFILLRTFCLACLDSSLQVSLRISNSLPFFLSLFKQFSYKSKEMDLLVSTLEKFEKNTDCLREMAEHGLVDILASILHDIVQNEKLDDIAHEKTYQPPSCCTRYLSLDHSFSKSGECSGYDADNSWHSINSILIVLLAVTRLENLSQKIIVALTSEEVWNSVLNCICFVPDTISKNAINILSSLGSSPKHFMSIYRNKLVLKIERTLLRAAHDDCYHCAYLYLAGKYILQKMSKAAECGMVYGELIHILAQDEPQAKRELAISVALVIRNGRSLLSYLSHHKCLDYIIEALDDPVLYEDAIVSISFMCKILGLNENVNLKLNTHPLFDSEKECFSSETKDTVIRHSYNVNILKSETLIQLEETKSSVDMQIKEESNDASSSLLSCSKKCVTPVSYISENPSVFKFNDGKRVSADKNLLISRSPMFEGMFRESNFKESLDEEILLQSISSQCFEHLVKLLKQFCVHNVPKDINILLELIIVSDRYLISDMTEKLLLYLMHAITFENSGIAYNWAIEHALMIFNNSAISDFIIVFLLTTNQTFQHTFEKFVDFERHKKAFQYMLSSQQRVHFLSDIKDMIFQVLEKLVAKQSRYSF